MAGYITNFFGCRECRVNFKKEIKQMPYKDTPEPHSAIVWLWKVHNSVNKRWVTMLLLCRMVACSLLTTISQQSADFYETEVTLNGL